MNLRSAEQNGLHFDLLSVRFRYLFALLLALWLCSLADKTTAAEDNQTIPGHLAQMNMQIIDGQDANDGTAIITDSLGNTTTLAISSEGQGTRFDIAAPATYTTTLVPDDGTATALYANSSPVTQTMVYSSAEVSYAGVPLDGTISTASITLDIGSDPENSVFPPTVTGFAYSDFGFHTQLSASGGGALKILEAAGTGADASLKVADVDFFFQEITVTAAAARPGFRLDATNITTTTSELTFRLGQAYPATWLDQPVTVVFTQVDLTNGSGSGTITNQQTSEMYSFTGADLNQSGDITLEEIDLTLIQWGENTVFLPAVAR